MIPSLRRTRDRPSHFLAALATGAVSISFFAYLTLLAPHPQTPLVGLDHLWPLLREGHPMAGALIGTALSAMLFFGLLQLYLLILSMAEYLRRRSQPDTGPQPADTVQMTLAVAMMFTVLLAIALVMIPGMSARLSILATLAMPLFAVLGIAPLRLLLPPAGDRLAGRPARAACQYPLLAAFALLMLGLGVLVSSVLAEHPALIYLGLPIAGLFLITAIVTATATPGLAEDRVPDAWRLIPLLTLLAMAVLCVDYALHIHGITPASPVAAALAGILFAQLLLAATGYRHSARRRRVTGRVAADAQHYAVICTGIGLFVSGMLAINLGLVGNGHVSAFSAAHLLLMAPFAYLQLRSLGLLLHLNRQTSGNPLNPHRAMPVPPPDRPGGSLPGAT